MIVDTKSAKAEFLDRQQDNKITTLYQYGDYLWICPSYSDIELYNLKQKTFHRIQNTGTGRNQLLDTYITDIVCVDDVNYYVATWKGLFSLKFDSKELTNSAWKGRLQTCCGTKNNRYCGLPPLEVVLTTCIALQKLLILWNRHSMRILQG